MNDFATAMSGPKRRQMVDQAACLVIAEMVQLRKKQPVPGVISYKWRELGPLHAHQLSKVLKPALTAIHRARVGFRQKAVLEACSLRCRKPCGSRLGLFDMPRYISCRDTDPLKEIVHGDVDNFPLAEPFGSQRDL